ncbi:MAG: 5-formyltetrahydrofolate cyclo-ligase [Candidatus Nanopelagicales bacterium]
MSGLAERPRDVAEPSLGGKSAEPSAIVQRSPRPWAGIPGGGSAVPPADPGLARGEKSRLRARLRAARAARTPAESQAAAAGLRSVAEREGLLNRQSIAGYLPMRGEPDVEPLLAQVAADGGRVWVPAPLPGRRLGWGALESPQARHHRLAVRMPTALHASAGAQALRELAVEVLLVPALAVDQRGVRLGHGGGYYDTLLAELDSGIRAIAVIFEDELVSEVPAEAHDARLRAVLTPGGLVELP